MLIFTVLIVWWPWKLGQGHQNLINSFITMIQYIVWPKSIIWFKRYGADKLFWSKFDIQSAGVTLKMRSRSPKSYHFFPMSQWCCQNPPIDSGYRGQTRLIFTVLIVWWSWKLGQGHQNLILWGKLCPPIGSGDRVQTMLIFTVLIVWWPWKLGQGHQNLINSLSQWYNT